MQAVVITRYGRPAEVLKLQEVDRPVLADNQVLVKVHAGSLNVADVAPVSGALIVRLFGAGWLRPKRTILGTDVAGVVEAVGSNVRRFTPGDEVFGAAAGSFAEYACAAENRLVLKPAGVTIEEAAAVPIAGVSALQGLRKGRIAPGQRVLIHGASGAVGTFAVQIARSYGAEVTAVCSTRNVEQARSLGAEHVIDYMREDFTAQAERYDLILAVNGNRTPEEYTRVLSPNGACVVLGGSMAQIFRAMLFGPLISKQGGKTVGFMGIASITLEDLITLQELLANGSVRPCIAQRYRLAEISSAVEYLTAGHAQGKIVITVC